MDQDGSIIKSYCNDCLQETNHHLIAHRIRRWDITDGDGRPVGEESMTYDFVQCCGCDSISLRREYNGPGEYESSVDYFPPAVSRRQPKWLTSIGFLSLHKPQMQIKWLLDEIYAAIFMGNYRLAMMGARAILDLALTDKLGDIGGFERKLDEAATKGWVTQVQHKMLSVAIEAGNAAAHRGYRPEKKQVDLVLDIVEHLIESFYVLEKAADEVAKQTPQRYATIPKPTRY